MNILNKIEQTVLEAPERLAIVSGSGRMTYKQLWERSAALAVLLREKTGEDRSPIPVYGHKDPDMLTAFLACMRSGHAYCPIDLSVPWERVRDITDSLPSKWMLTTEDLPENMEGKEILDLRSFVLTDPVEVPMRAVEEKENLYLIFTSGSTGAPKGVQISRANLEAYLDWAVGLGSTPEEKKGQVFLNQAPFSFDLSVMDLYTSLMSGGTLFCLSKEVQGNYKELLEALKQSQAQVWVSTPSFAELCLADPAFAQGLLPKLEVFLFCGEPLTVRTVKKLYERFPESRVINTYGPTESTVCVTEVLITKAHLELEALPVGRARPGTRILIVDADGKVLQDGEEGEIVLLGDTVSRGYYKRDDLTEKVFFTDAEGIRGYHTGDLGYLKDEMLYCCGRMDLQIKLHGYRIELGDIENNLLKLPQVEQAVVVPKERGGKIASLTAVLVCADGVPSDKKQQNTLTTQLKKALSLFLPAYMIPKKMVYVEQLPVTRNGKADRKQIKDVYA